MFGFLPSGQKPADLVHNGGCTCEESSLGGASFAPMAPTAEDEISEISKGPWSPGEAEGVVLGNI